MMHRHTRWFSWAAPLFVLALAGAARADDGAYSGGPPRPWFAAIGAGMAYPTLSHPEVVGGAFLAPTLRLQGGYTFHDRFSVGVEVTEVESAVGRDSPPELFKLGYSPQAECTKCAPKPPGADIRATNMSFTTLGARAEYAPFGRDGLFLGGTAGLAFIVGLEGKLGAGLGGRVGYRLRPTEVLTLSLEGGIEGQVYKDASLYMPYVALLVRPYF